MESLEHEIARTILEFLKRTNFNEKEKQSECMRVVRHILQARGILK